jgi:uncharacterized protein YndB with AHSA1/START domain
VNRAHLTRSADEGQSRTDSPRSQTGVRRATGRERSEWFAVLDAWGAAGRPYREIADWLTGEHGLSNWWAQKLIVEYEQARGLRPPGVRRDGTFEVGATKTVAVPIQQAFSAFTDPGVRERWLPSADLTERESERENSARFDWEGGKSRVAVTFTASGTAKTQIVVQHERIPDAAAAERLKAYWRERLSALKEMLEG